MKGSFTKKKAFNNEVLEVQGDGEDKLDFTYIDDLVDGITKVVCTDKPKNEVYNITYVLFLLTLLQ